VKDPKVLWARLADANKKEIRIGFCFVCHILYVKDKYFLADICVVNVIALNKKYFIITFLLLF